MVKIKKIALMLLTTALVGIVLTFSNVALAAADSPLLSLDNTNFVVSIAFFAFVAVLIYLRVPAKILGLLDNREQSIRDEIEGATSILEESKSLLAELEREHKVNISKAEKIVQEAETEAKRLLSESKKEIRLSIERKIRLAEEQIKATEDAVIKSIRDRAIDKAVSHAENHLGEMPKSKMSKAIMEDSFKRLDESLKKLI
jgi:F-type H+-transporting ATPase subunit b